MKYARPTARSRGGFWFVLSLVVCLSGPCWAGPTPRVYAARLELNWFGDNHRCWYRVDRPGGGREFMVVDTRGGSRRQAFDYDAVLKRVNAAEGAGLSEIVHLDFVREGAAIELSGPGGRWVLDLNSGEVAPTDEPPRRPHRLHPIGAFTRSRGQGANTTILFRNDSEAEVAVDWIDVGGAAQRRFSLKPGEAHRQPTHVRHVWRVSNGDAWRAYRASIEDSTVVIRPGDLGPVGSGGKVASPDYADDRLAPISESTPSKVTGDALRLPFENRTAEPLRVEWVDYRGLRRFFFTLLPGQSKRHHCYAGHVWRVSSDTGEAYYQASDGALPVLVERRDLMPLESGSSGPPSVSSPDGAWEAFVRDDNLWIRPAGGEGSERRLSTAGSATSSFRRSAQRRRSISLVYDQPDYPATLPDVRWSPDSRRLVALRTDVVPEPTMTIVSSRPGGRDVRPVAEQLPYLRPGDPLPEQRLHLFDVERGREIEVVGAPTPSAYRLDHFRWEPDSSAFFFLFNQRGHQLARLYRIDPSTGEARTVVEETAESFLNYSHKTYVRHLEATDELIWMSERSGFNHLYLYRRDGGGPIRPISAGDWVVKSVRHVNEQRREVYAMARGFHADQDHGYEHLVRLSLDDGETVCLTRGDAFHEVRFSPDRRHFLDTASRVDLPPRHTLRRTSDGGAVCELERADISELEADGFRPPERFTAPGRDGQTPIEGILHLPRDFDPTRRYPVVENIYASPSNQYVPKTFRWGYGHQRKIADAGFVVVKIDGMGTNWRSRAFHDVAWKNLADAGFPDRIAWMKHAAETRPWMDLSRVGIYGGSAGGQNALRALIDHHDFYRAAVADCGCHDNRVDKLWWNEAWMGWPVDESYARSSNVVHAHRMRGHLLLSVGEVDRNVDPANTFQVVDALRRAGKDFELLVFPGLGHAAIESAYGRRKRLEFFQKHLTQQPTQDAMTSESQDLSPRASSPAD